MLTGSKNPLPPGTRFLSSLSSFTYMSKSKPEPKRKRGRPETRVLKLNVSSPEEAFRRIFAAADPPDPSKRKIKNRPSVSPNDKRPPPLEDFI